jgi:hypothetical protein
MGVQKIGCADQPVRREDALSPFVITISSLFQNRSKVVWSGHQILRTDPRRLWTTGLTVEKVNARVWYFDRMVVLVSEPFNILMESDCSPPKSLFLTLFSGVYDPYPILG